MRILMLGNSFTSANQMPQMLAALTGGAPAWRRRPSRTQSGGTRRQNENRDKLPARPAEDRGVCPAGSGSCGGSFLWISHVKIWYAQGSTLHPAL